MDLQAQTAELRTAVAGLQETATAMNMDLLRGTLSELKDSVATMKARTLGAPCRKQPGPAQRQVFKSGLSRHLEALRVLWTINTAAGVVNFLEPNACLRSAVQGCAASF